MPTSIIRVYSGATDPVKDGSTWDKGYLTISAGLAAAIALANAVVWVAKDHSETGTAVTWTGKTAASSRNGVVLVSVNRTSNLYDPATTNQAVYTTSMTLNGRSMFVGLRIKSVIALGQQRLAPVRFVACSIIAIFNEYMFSLALETAYGLELYRCTLDSDDTANTSVPLFNIATRYVVRLFDCVFASGNLTYRIGALVNLNNSDAAIIEATNCDFSGLENSYCGVQASAPLGYDHTIRFHRCKLPYAWQPRRSSNIMLAGYRAGSFYHNTVDVENQKVIADNTVVANVAYDVAFLPSKRHEAFATASGVYLFIREQITGALVSIAGAAPAGVTYGCDYNPAGTKLAVAHTSSPYISIYDVAGGYTKDSNPGNLPAGNGKSCRYSPDGSLLAVGHTTSPYLTVYNTSDMSVVTLTGGNPAGQVNSVAFSSDGSLLACAHATTPYVTIYNTSDWSKVTDPSTLPAGTGNRVAFDPAGDYLAVGHATSPYLTVYDTSDWSTVTLGGNPPSATTGLDFTTSGNYLCTLQAITSTTPTSYDVSDWSVMDGFDSPAVVSSQTAMRRVPERTVFGVAWGATGSVNVLGAYACVGTACWYDGEAGADDDHIFARDLTGWMLSRRDVYRADGGQGSDQNPISWYVETSSFCGYDMPFRTPWMHGVVTASGAQYIDVFVYNVTADLYTNQIWLEVEGVDENSGALPVGAFLDDMYLGEDMDVTTAQDDDTSTWGGSSAYSQRLRVTTSSLPVGSFRCRVVVGAPDKSIWLDPIPVVTAVPS